MNGVHVRSNKIVSTICIVVLIIFGITYLASAKEEVFCIFRVVKLAGDIDEEKLYKASDIREITSRKGLAVFILREPIMSFSDNDLVRDGSNYAYIKIEDKVAEKINKCHFTIIARRDLSLCSDPFRQMGEVKDALGFDVKMIEETIFYLKRGASKVATVVPEHN